MEALNQFVICKKKEKEVSMTSGGITIPEKSSDFVSTEISFVGKGVEDTVSIQVGRTAIIPSNSKIYRTEGKEFFVVKEEDIVLVK